MSSTNFLVAAVRYLKFLSKLSNSGGSYQTVPSVRRAGLLWLAPDHVHVYCCSDGEKSPEETALGLKQLLARGILAKCPEVVSDFAGDSEIWEDGYFAETLDSF